VGTWDAAGSQYTVSRVKQHVSRHITPQMRACSPRVGACCTAALSFGSGLIRRRAQHGMTSALVAPDQRVWERCRQGRWRVSAGRRGTAWQRPCMPVWGRSTVPQRQLDGNRPPVLRALQDVPVAEDAGAQRVHQKLAAPLTSRGSLPHIVHALGSAAELGSKPPLCRVVQSRSKHILVDARMLDSMSGVAPVARVQSTCFGLFATCH
jgi:hypothetical protein